MSKLKGGIFSKPSGQTAGLVFGAARTRTGKVATVRQLVPPSNPNTAAQQAQRNKFKDALAIVRAIGADIYKDDFNRAISQLPGFQSMMSIMTNGLTDSLEIIPPPPTNLGTLHFPDQLSVSNDLIGELKVDFSQELGANGAETDKVAMIVIAKDPASSAQNRIVITSKNAGVRGSGSASVVASPGTLPVIVGVYLQGSDVYSGLLTQCRWLVGNIN